MAGQAAEQRPIVAHGFSRGFIQQDESAPEGAKEYLSVGFLPPHPGLESWLDD